MSGPTESRMQGSAEQTELRMGTKKLIYVTVSAACTVLFIMCLLGWFARHDNMSLRFAGTVVIAYDLVLLLLSRYRLVLADGRLSYSVPLRRTKSLLLSGIERVELKSRWEWHGLRYDYIDRLILHPRASAGKRAIVIDHTVFDSRQIRRLLNILEPELGERADLP